MVLCYVSSHGIKDDLGRLHLVTTDTEWDALAVTTLAAIRLREMIDSSRARQTVLWLDCCYSDAFPSGRSPKSGGSVDVVDQLTAHSGRGCAVMTASTAVQYAFEGDAGARATGPLQPPVFTEAIVRGLSTGAADLDSDGLVDAAELYRYVFDEVKRSSPDQTPTRNDQVVGDLYIAQSGRGLPVDPALPLEIHQGLRSSMPRIRQAAVDELAELAATGDVIAVDTLGRLSTHTDGELARMACAALGNGPALAPAKAPEPAPVEVPMTPEPVPAVVEDVVVDHGPVEVPWTRPLRLPPGVAPAPDLSTTLANGLGVCHSVAFSPDGQPL